MLTMFTDQAGAPSEEEQEVQELEDPFLLQSSSGSPRSSGGRGTPQQPP